MLDATIPRNDYLSIGSTLLNLACSGTPYGALAVGKFFWMVGDSSSGKTWLTMNALAEATINKRFDEYDLILNNAEDGALMDISRYFGPRLAQRLQPPEWDGDVPVYSQTAEHFYFHLDDRLTLVEKGKAPPFIELLDSMDALDTKYNRTKFQEKKKASRSGKKAAGQYGDGKAALNSSVLRDITARLRNTGSILIVLSQTRDNIDAGMFDPKQTVAGGRALKFYATWQLWSSVGKKLTREINGKRRQTGIISRVAIKKNRMTGKEWTVEIPIYHSSGIDDTGSMVDFLVEERHWKQGEGEDGKGPITAPEMDFQGSRAALIRKIEEGNLEPKLRLITTEVWEGLEQELAVERKNRYQV